MPKEPKRPVGNRGQKHWDNGIIDAIELSDSRAARSEMKDH
jgi:hypothetical protein